MAINHFVTASCGGEHCRMCGKPATHKVEEAIMWDDPNPHRHPYTAYLCCECFGAVMGPAVVCEE